MLLNIKNSSYDIKKILKVACNVDGVLRDEFGAWIVVWLGVWVAAWSY